MTSQRNGNALAVVAHKKGVFNLIYLWENRLISSRLLFKTFHEFLIKFTNNCFSNNPCEKCLSCFCFTTNEMIHSEIQKLNLKVNGVQIYFPFYEALCNKELGLDLMLSAVNDNIFEVSKSIDFGKIKNEFNSVDFTADKLISPTMQALILSLGEILYREQTDQLPFLLSHQSNNGWISIFEKLDGYYI